MLAPGLSLAARTIPFCDRDCPTRAATPVEGVDIEPTGQIVAICVRERIRQAIRILDLPLPTPAPKGAEWIAAYRHWLGPE